MSGFKLFTPATAVKTITISITIDDEGFQVETETQSEIYFCEWKNAFGNEVIQSNSLNAVENATIRLYYMPLNSNDRILKVDDNTIWNIIGRPDNVNNRSQFMEVKLMRVVNG